MAGVSFRGTTIEQDSKFGDPEKKLIKKMKMSSALNSKVRLVR